MNARRPVLLDFGGTLDSEGKHWSTQFADSFAAVGIHRPRSVLDSAFLAADRALNDDPRAATMSFAEYVLDYVRRILSSIAMSHESGPESEDSSWQADAVAEEFLRRARANLRGSGALLAQHSHRYRFAVVSNFTANLPIILADVGIRQTLDGVVCSAIEGVRKPDPAIFRLALHRLGIGIGEGEGEGGGRNLNEAVMIGDSLGNDILPAKSLGMTTVWLRGDTDYSGGDPAAADHVVTSLAEAFHVLSDSRVEGRI